MASNGGWNSFIDVNHSAFLGSRFANPLLQLTLYRQIPLVPSSQPSLPMVPLLIDIHKCAQVLEESECTRTSRVETECASEPRLQG